MSGKDRNVTNGAGTAAEPEQGASLTLAPPRDPAMRWHLGWAVGALGGMGLLLVAVGRPSILALLAMLIIGLPALIGAIWRPKGVHKSVYLVTWALAASMAATLEGGLGGPLAVWCVMPAVVTVAIEASWAAGFGLSAASILVVAAINALHLAWRAPHQPLTFWLSLVAVLTTAGGAVGALAVGRLRARDGLAASEAELHAFQALVGDLPELAMTLTLDGRAETVFGEPLAGVDPARLHAGIGEIAEAADRPAIAAALTEASTTGSAHATFTPEGDGQRRLLLLVKSSANGGLIGILREAPPAQRTGPRSKPIDVTLVADLNRRVSEAEAARRNAEQEATARARFLANMSHELRTPLNAIMGFSDIMRVRMFGDLQPKYLEYAELIHESGRHLLDLINDVLDISKIEAQRYELSRELFDAREAVNGALRLVRLQADEAGIKLRGVLPAEPLEVDADRRALKQITLNLVSNALKFTPKGGAVSVAVAAAAGAFELVVSDSGVGIAPEDLARLGRPYEQAGGADSKAQGTGLGLSLVRALAELHGGRMSVESRLGEGTAVTVRMPVLAGLAAATSADAEH